MRGLVQRYTLPKVPSPIAVPSGNGPPLQAGRSRISSRSPLHASLSLIAARRCSSSCPGMRDPAARSSAEAGAKDAPEAVATEVATPGANAGAVSNAPPAAEDGAVTARGASEAGAWSALALSRWAEASEAATLRRFASFSVVTSFLISCIVSS